MEKVKKSASFNEHKMVDLHVFNTPKLWSFVSNTPFLPNSTIDLIYIQMNFKTISQIF